MLASSAGGPRFSPQSRTASYQRRYKNDTSSDLFSTEHSNGKILALSQELRSRMENPSKSEVIGRCGGDEKTE